MLLYSRNGKPFGNYGLIYGGVISLSACLCSFGTGILDRCHKLVGEQDAFSVRLSMPSEFVAYTGMAPIIIERQHYLPTICEVPS